eukprot:1294976-Ditylum_brightwellii.AAC.1
MDGMPLLQTQPSPGTSSSSANVNTSAGSGTSSFLCHISTAHAPPTIALTEHNALQAALNKIYECS